MFCSATILKQNNSADNKTNSFNILHYLFFLLFNLVLTL